MDLDPGALAPGWWTVVLDDGTVWPRAVLVEAAEQVVVSRWTVDDDELAVTGAGFAEGASAWAVWGTERVPTAIPVLDVESGALRLDLSAVPTDERVDVGVWTAGGIVGIPDARIDGSRVPFVREPSIPVGGCGCNVPPLSEPIVDPRAGWTILAILLAMRRRNS